jgi:hypothetical protein
MALGTTFPAASLICRVTQPITAHPPAQSGSATLSRELADFLVELQIALHKHAIYPAEHPLVEAAVEGVVRRMWELFSDRGVLSIGVARRQLIIEGVATDPEHPLLRELAQRLHRHHLGAIKLSNGVTSDEIAEVLATLGGEAGRTPAETLGARTVELNATWPHVKLFPLTYGQLQLVDESTDDDEAMKSSKAAQLWVGLARAAMAAERIANSTGEHTADDPAMEPVAVAKAIDDHQREVAYDQVVVGYLLQITDELRHARGKETAALQRRISRLVSSLTPETLSTLLAMGGDTSQRRRFVLDAAQGMTVDAVVEVVKAAAAAEKQTVSHSMLRLLSKLAQHAEADPARRRAADVALRENVGRLVGEWALEDPNPEAYSLVLQQFASATQGDLSMESPPLTCEPERILQMSLELGVEGPPVIRAIDAMVSKGPDGILRVLDLLEGAPDEGDSARALWQMLLDRDPLRVLLASPKPDAALIQRLIHRQGASAAAALLDAFEENADTKSRERISEMLATLGPDVGSMIAHRVKLVPTPSQRELLVLLGRLPALPAEFDPSKYLRSHDPLVRREALRLALRESDTVDSGARARVLREGLADSDSRVVFVALGAAADRCPREVIPVLLRRVEQHELDAALRAHAIRVVAAQRDPAHVPWLVSRVATQGRFLRRSRLFPTSPEMLAAVAALGAYWREDVRAKAAIELAASAHDPEVRQALAAGAQRLTPLRSAAARADAIVPKSLTP